MQVNSYIPSPRDESLSMYREYYCLNGRNHVKRALIICIIEQDRDRTLYAMQNLENGNRLKSDHDEGLYFKGELYDNKEDCKNRTHDLIDNWEDFRNDRCV